MVVDKVRGDGSATKVFRQHSGAICCTAHTEGCGAVAVLAFLRAGGLGLARVAGNHDRFGAGRVG